MDEALEGTSAAKEPGSKTRRPTRRQRIAAKSAGEAAAAKAERDAAAAKAEREAAEEAAKEVESATNGAAAVPVMAPPAAIEPTAAVDEPAMAAGDRAVNAERVELRMSAVGRVQSDDLRVEQGAVGAARVENLTIDRGAVGAAMADRVEVSRGYARSILARQVQLDRAAARIVIAADVRANQSAAMLLIARKVDGNVRVLLDWRGALAFGAVAGLVFALVSRVRRKRGK